MYAEAMPVLRAREQADRIEAATAPYLSKEGYRELIRSLSDVLRNDAPAVRPESLDDFAAMGIQVSEEK